MSRKNGYLSSSSSGRFNNFDHAKKKLLFRTVTSQVSDVSDVKILITRQESETERQRERERERDREREEKFFVDLKIIIILLHFLFLF